MYTACKAVIKESCKEWTVKFEVIFIQKFVLFIFQRLILNFQLPKFLRRVFTKVFTPQPTTVTQFICCTFSITSSAQQKIAKTYCKTARRGEGKCFAVAKKKRAL